MVPLLQFLLCAGFDDERGFCGEVQPRDQSMPLGRQFPSDEPVIFPKSWRFWEAQSPVCFHSVGLLSGARILYVYMQVYRYRMYITHVKASCKRKPTIYNLAKKWHEWVRDQCAVVIRVWSSLFRTATKAKTRDFGHLVSITWLLCRRIAKIVRFVVASVEPIQRDFVNLLFAIHQRNQILMRWCLASLYTGLIANTTIF